jgi:hypothetical protein
MGYHPKRKNKVRPSLRGEIWQLWDDRTVTVLKHLAAGVVEVINEKGTLEAVQDSQFYKRLLPPMPPSQ